MRRALIIGGYGAVGGQVAEHLARSPDAAVTIAGRNKGKAQALARRLGCGVEAISLDAQDRSALEVAIQASDTVVSCTERALPEIADECIRYGRNFLAVSASAETLGNLRGRHDAALRSNSTGVIGVGLAPGITNLLARESMKLGSDWEELTVVVELAALDRHGPEAISWIMEQAAPVKGADLILPIGARHGIPLPFTGGEPLAAKLGLGKVDTYLLLRPQWATRALPFVGRAMGRLAGRSEPAHAMLCRQLARASPWTGRFRIGAVVRKPRATASAWLTGRDQSRATGIVAAETARLLLEGSAPAGIHDLGDLLGWPQMEGHLRKIGCRVTVDDGGGGKSPATLVTPTGGDAFGY
jgi:hypothetical protein